MLYPATVYEHTDTAERQVRLFDKYHLAEFVCFTW